MLAILSDTCRCCCTACSLPPGSLRSLSGCCVLIPHCSALLTWPGTPFSRLGKLADPQLACPHRLEPSAQHHSTPLTQQVCSSLLSPSDSLSLRAAAVAFLHILVAVLAQPEVDEGRLGCWCGGRSSFHRCRCHSFCRLLGRLRLPRSPANLCKGATVSGNKRCQGLEHQSDRRVSSLQAGEYEDGKGDLPSGQTDAGWQPWNVVP